MCEAIKVTIGLIGICVSFAIIGYFGYMFLIKGGL